MTVFIPGYSSLTGNAETILCVLKSSRFLDQIPEAQNPNIKAETLLRTLAERKIIEIKEEKTWQ